MKLSHSLLLIVVAATMIAPAVMAATIDLRTVPVVPVESNTGPRPGRTANYFLMSRMDLGQVEALARYDLLILGLENAVNNREVLDAIRAKHPDVKLLFYVQSNEFPIGGYQNNEPSNGPWHQLYARLDTTRHLLRSPDGSAAQFWPGTRSYNLCDTTVPPILADWIAEQFRSYPWDGVFVDNVWTNMQWYCAGNVDSDHNGVKDDMRQFSQHWTTNLKWLGQLIRQRIGPDRILMGNIGGDTGDDHRFWTDVANGRMFEGWPNTLNLPALYAAYLDPSLGWVRPGTTVVHCEANENETAKIRFGWYFTLLGNGAFAVDHGPNSGPGDDNGWHDQCQWYPELFQSDYGPPVAAAFRDDASRVWVREFSRGLVVWNPMPSTASLDFTLRSGRSLKITIAGHDGSFFPTGD